MSMLHVSSQPLATPDRGVGPWDRISISVTQCVIMRDPYVITTLNDRQDVATWDVWVSAGGMCCDAMAWHGTRMLLLR